MKYILIVLLFIFTLPSARSQQVIYDENAELREVGSFSGIEVSGTISLYLSQDTETGVVVSAGDEKYNSKIKTEVRNGILVLSVDGGVWNSFSLANRKLKAYVSVKDLSKLQVSGASYVTINGVVNTSSLNMDIAGASEVKGNIKADHLKLSISGASEMNLSGSVKEAMIDATGASDINAYNLSVEKLKASTSGASQLKITVTNEMSADASGGSRISYKGKPGTSRINAASGASIKNRD